MGTDSRFSVPEAQPFWLRGGDTGILLVHGFTGSVAHMRPLGESLHERGYSVRGFNLPGHATSMEDMKGTTWRDWLSATRAALEELRQECGRVCCCGLSMGGVMTLLLAEEGLTDAAVTISAPMAVLNKYMPFARLAAPFMPVFLWGEGDPDRPYVLDQRYDLGYEGFPTRTAADLSHLIKAARKGLGSITCPVLSVQSHDDETISADSLEVIQAGVQSKKRKALWLEGVPHVCTISPERERIAGAIDTFLREAGLQR